MRPCYAFSAAAGANKPATLSIFDEIGFWGVQAKEFLSQLGAVEAKELTVEINSPGGDVFAALTMYNGLRASGKEITTKVMGVAASAASLLFLAGDKRVMPKNTQVMAHHPWTVTAGNADDLEETAATLRKIGASMAGTYAARTGIKVEEIEAMLSKDTWMTADECLANGFATEVIEEIKVSAKFDLARADLPAAVRASLGLPPAEAAEEAPPTDIVPPTADPAEAPAVDAAPIADQVAALAKAAGLEAYAATFTLKCPTVAEAQARIGVAREINALCASVKKPEAAAAFIKDGKTVAEARASMIEVMAKADENNHTDTTPPRADGTKALSPSGKKPVTTASLWDSHNKQSAKKGS